MARKSVGRFEFDRNETSDEFKEALQEAIQESDRIDIDFFEIEDGGIIYEVLD